MVERDIALAAYEQRSLHIMHLSAQRVRVSRPRGSVPGVGVSAEVTPHHLCLTDDSVRTLDPNLKMNLPVRSDEHRSALVDALRDGTIAVVATDHAPSAPREGSSVRRGALRCNRAGDGVRRAEHAACRARCAPPHDPPRAHVRRSRAHLRPTRPTVAVGHRANIAVLDLDAEWMVSEDVFRSRSHDSWSWGAPSRARHPDDRRRQSRVRIVSNGYVLLEDGTVFPRPLDRRRRRGLWRGGLPRRRCPVTRRR